MTESAISLDKSVSPQPNLFIMKANMLQCRPGFSKLKIQYLLFNFPLGIKLFQLRSASIWYEAGFMAVIWYLNDWKWFHSEMQFTWKCREHIFLRCGQFLFFGKWEALLWQCLTQVQNIIASTYWSILSYALSWFLHRNFCLWKHG